MAATLTVNPTTVIPGGHADIEGAGFDPKYKFSLETVDANGVAVGQSTNTNRPRRDGTFLVGIYMPPVVGPAKVRAYQRGLIVATKDILVQSSIPTPSAFTDLPGWKLVLADEFDRYIPRGHFLDGSTDGYFTADKRYSVYKNGWYDTSKNGAYDPSIIEVKDSILDIAIQWRDGRPRVCAFTAHPAGATSKGGLSMGARIHTRIRADKMIGYKGVPMLWADDATTNDLLLKYGENDYPEANFDASPRAYIHRTGATSFGDQHVLYTPSGTSWQDWHDYVMEWIPGVSIECFVDNVSIGKVTDRIASEPMHANWQFETWTNGTMPSSAVSGHVQIDRIGMWVPA